MEAQEFEPGIHEIEDLTFNEIDILETPPPDVIAYNELRSCADLFRMQRQGILNIQPPFQREIVWSPMKRTRFIDSLLKQLPIPSMCFSLDYRTQKWQVVDGLQRMWSIVSFLRGDDWRLSRLDDIEPSLSGKKASEFLDENSSLHEHYIRIENLALPITVIRCDYSKQNHMEYLFTIFHRLNSGADKLTNQEIRNCIFSGVFNELLQELDQNTDWLGMNNRTEDKSDRYRGQEQILRIFAFHDDYHNYQGRLAVFLNDYMEEHRRSNPDLLMRKKELFERTINIAHQSIFKNDAETRKPLSVIEGVLVGISRNLDYLQGVSSETITEMYQRLLASEEFSDEKLKEGLSGKQRVLERMSIADQIFSGVIDG